MLQELGFTYASQGNTTVAIATFEDNLARNPTFYLSHYSLGQIYCTERRDVGKGRAHLDSFIKRAEASKRSPELGAPRVPKLDEYIKEAHTLLRDCGR